MGGKALVARADALPLPEDGQLKDPALGEDGRIEDFGEKIGGARKDLFAFRFRVDTDLPSDWSSLSKASAFPEPPYARLQEAGIPARTLAVVAALRDAIPAKPRHRSSYRRKRWRALLEATREACVAVLDNPGKAESVIATLEASSEMKGVLKRADLLLELLQGRLVDLALVNLRLRALRPGFCDFQLFKLSPDDAHLRI